MKKILTISLVLIMLVMTLGGVVNAATSATLADEIYTKTSKYGVTEADKVRMERYLTENPVTDEQANQIIAKADEAIAIMENAGVTNYAKLTDAQKTEMKEIAKEAAEIINVKLVFKKGYVEIYNAEGKLVETISETNGKLAYTGNSVNMVLVVSTIAIFALAITFVAKRTFANAK